MGEEKSVYSELILEKISSTHSQESWLKSKDCLTYKRIRKKMSSTVTQQRMEVEQLRREAAMKRIPVSQAVDDIKRYVQEKAPEDCLITGFHGNRNPFREKSSCSVL